jgi:hypothetical protein
LGEGVGGTKLSTPARFAPPTPPDKYEADSLKLPAGRLSLVQRRAVYAQWTTACKGEVKVLISTEN